MYELYLHIILLIMLLLNLFGNPCSRLMYTHDLGQNYDP